MPAYTPHRKPNVVRRKRGTASTRPRRTQHPLDASNRPKTTTATTTNRSSRRHSRSRNTAARHQKRTPLRRPIDGRMHRGCGGGSQRHHNLSLVQPGDDDQGRQALHLVLCTRRPDIIVRWPISEALRLSPAACCVAAAVAAMYRADQLLTASAVEDKGGRRPDALLD